MNSFAQLLLDHSELYDAICNNEFFNASKDSPIPVTARFVWCPFPIIGLVKLAQAWMKLRLESNLDTQLIVYCHADSFTGDSDVIEFTCHIASLPDLSCGHVFFPNDVIKTSFVYTQPSSYPIGYVDTSSIFDDVLPVDHFFGDSVTPRAASPSIGSVSDLFGDIFSLDRSYRQLLDAASMSPLVLGAPAINDLPPVDRNLSDECNMDIKPFASIFDDMPPLERVDETPQNLFSSFFDDMVKRIGETPLLVKNVSIFDDLPPLERVDETPLPKAKDATKYGPWRVKRTKSIYVKSDRGVNDRRLETPTRKLNFSF